jgi:signal transduction histidine kinase
MPRLAYPLSVLGLGLACYIAALAGIGLSPTGTLITPVWAVTGIAFGVIYLYGYRLWPGLFVGLLAALAQSQDHSTASDIYLLIAGPAGIFTLEVLCSVWLIRHISVKRTFLDTPATVFRFLAVAVLVTVAGSSLINVLLHAGGALPQSQEFTLWLTQWLGSMTGFVLVAPAVVAFAKPYSVQWTRPLLAEASAAFLVVYVASHVLFGVWSLGVFTSPLPQPIVMVLLWVGIRFGMREMGLALLLVALVAVHGTLIGVGPYLAESLTEAMLLTLTFLIVIAAGFYTLAAALLENRRSTTALRDINVTLEQRVRRRTDALAQANEELQQYRDRLEELVAERTADLELANREIESFSYSVSHDLRSPLRAIDGYSHALLEDYGDQLDAKALNYLKRSRAASQRMGLLIDDVLLLSRVTRHELELNQVDLTTIAHEVIKEIESADRKREVEFVIQDSLYVQGDEHLLRIVLENLLGNAWKYSARKPKARIEFGMRETRSEFVFFVRDNGIGFDMHYQDQLFGAFQRLHDPEEFEGTGIGLATVARVMTRHGGRVWAKGKVNVGAIFYFAFPERGRTTGPRKGLQSIDVDI